MRTSSTVLSELFMHLCGGGLYGEVPFMCVREKYLPSPITEQF